ncbi:hypothetical protein EDB81DRAFT_897122 [Dactylonectria macrodidyma]|uniref:Uncharacterized protein n=1 Tax=Dactylonectria macrodidyma TaxID=307937 RepID=A0A9P9FVJ3_9HYPO|nr:hypothetical protein EDB81DRAFT_897122 [Dactylonectria macrodidyma]
MDDSYSMCSQLMSCLFTSKSLSSDSSASNLLRPSLGGRRHMSFPMGFDSNFDSSYRVDLTPPSMGKHIFGLGLPNTRMEQEGKCSNYGRKLEMNIPQHSSMGPLTPWNYLSSGSEGADTSTSGSLCANRRLLSFFTSSKMPNDFSVLDLDPCSQSLDRYSLHDAASSNKVRARQKIRTRQIQYKTDELQRARPRPRCYHKAFRRTEHLRRHKQTLHGEGLNRFSYNLYSHRKLHTRPTSNSRGVKFIPAAVPIIEQEERGRNPRAPSKARAAEKRGVEF